MDSASPSPDLRKSSPSTQSDAASVVVIVVTWNGLAVIDDCCRSVLGDVSPGVRASLIVVDNGSSDATADFVARQFPSAELIRLPANLGFCEGNNVGWEFVRRMQPRPEFVVLLNHDTIVEPGWLTPLVATLRSDAAIAAAQPKLLLYPPLSTTPASADARINSAGNRSHYLGFGFTLGFDEPDCARFDAEADIDFPSGAAVMVRASALEQLGLFEPEMFTYLEDADLGWKLRLAGFRIRYVPTSRVRHKYVRKSGWSHYEHLERNRWWLLFVYYRVQTLLLLLPALAAMELGQFLFAARYGIVGAKLRAWGWFLKPAHRKRVRVLRAAAARRRKLSDRQFMGRFSSTIDSSVLGWRAARLVVNSVFRAYFLAVRPLLRW